MVNKRVNAAQVCTDSDRGTVEAKSLWDVTFGRGTDSSMLTGVKVK